MIRRIVILVVVVLTALGAYAGENRDRDVVLTSDGVLYSVETAYDAGAGYGRSNWHLTMTVQNGEARTTTPVPGSLTGGAHSSPALGYDADSKTLFLFWQESLNGGLSSRLLFSSYQNGTWSEATALDSIDWNLRRNLRIAVTRSIESTDREGRRGSTPQVVVHAVWWEESGYGEWARYAMLGIDGGLVTSKDLRYLGEFAGPKIDQTRASNTTAADEVLRHPAISASPTRDSVDVIFGNTQTSAMHRLRLKPVLDGRLRIPIGVRETNLRHASLSVGANSRAAAVVHENDLALYTISKKSVDFVVYRDGAWSSQRSIALGDDVTAETAVEALRRLVSEQ